MIDSEAGWDATLNFEAFFILQTVFRMQTFHALITITLRKGILDVQGKTVEQSLHAIGFDGIADVQIGKHVELTVSAENRDAAYSLVQDACGKLIANPIMEDFHIELRETVTAQEVA